jgi:RimJ/RimL family protein N-acetyltransferase
MTSLFTGNLLRLAAPLPEDAEAFSRASQDDDYLRQVDTAHALPRSPQAAAESFIKYASGPDSVVFHLRTLTEDKVIGFVSIHSIEWNNQTGILSIGIIDEAYRGKGYGSDALKLILNYAFNELNLYRVGLDVIASNSRAVRAYEKSGFRREGAMRSSIYRDGVRNDRIIMGILRPEWESGERIIDDGR